MPPWFLFLDKVAYWAVKGTGSRQQFALAYRSGLGRVVSMHTTDLAFGPGKYTLITRHGRNAQIKYADEDNIVITYLMEETSPLILLTESQRTPELFLLRKFRIIGTGSYGVWKLLSHLSADNLDQNMEAVIRILSMGNN